MRKPSENSKSSAPKKSYPPKAKNASRPGDAPPKKTKFIPGSEGFSKPARPRKFEPREARPVKERRPPKETAPHQDKVEEAAPVEAFEPQEAPVLFTDLGLSDRVMKAILELGFESPTPIQARSIPLLIEGKDLIGQAQTGTGKTAAFAIPLIEKIELGYEHVQALVMVPTRELAIQVAGGIYELAKHTGARVVPVYGGQPIDRQFRALRAGAQIVVGTPGRILDHLRRGSLDLSLVTFCTLDEADEMMALGFAEDMDAILSMLPEGRQLAFFSATMPPRIVALTKKYLGNAQHISIEPKRRTVETTNQTYYEVPKGKKLEALARVLDMESPGSTIVFCRTRQETNDLCEALRIRGYNAEALHGDMGQSERDRVMKRFRESQADLLVATDVAARGLDIDSVTHVINYDIPWDVEQYIHRIGRTGRAGRSGDAITLVEGRQRRQLEAIERLIGVKIKPAKIPTAADIASRRREMFKDVLKEALEAAEFDSHIVTVEDLLEEYEPVEVAAAALHLLWQTQHSSKDEDQTGDFEQPELGMTRIFLGMGRQHGLRPGEVVGAIVGEAGIPAKVIGVIDILDRTTFVEVPSSDGERVIEALRNTRIKGQKIKVQLANPSEGVGEERRRPPRRDRR